MVLKAGSRPLLRVGTKRRPEYIYRAANDRLHQTGGTMGVKTSTLEGGIGLIEAKGSLIGGDETVDLRAGVAGFAEREYQKLLIDLSNVTYLNSTAIGVLVSAHTTYTRKGWQIKVCGVNKNINNIFVITKLTLVFDVHDTREEAIKSFT
jgi:anti-sigma B factor antagonist